MALVWSHRERKTYPVPWTTALGRRHDRTAQVDVAGSKREELTMAQAIKLTQIGAPDVLELTTVERVEPGSTEA
ncbi:MAG: hypothetical protein AMXMBFR8_04350 [Nevskiales bacterium]